MKNRFEKRYVKNIPELTTQDRMHEMFAELVEKQIENRTAPIKRAYSKIQNKVVNSFEKEFTNFINMTKSKQKQEEQNVITNNETLKPVETLVEVIPAQTEISNEQVVEQVQTPISRRSKKRILIDDTIVTENTKSI